MIFDEPTGFSDALAYVQKRELLPTTMSSEQLRNLNKDLRDRSFFSARVWQANILQELADKVDSSLSRLTNRSEARWDLREFIESTGYEPSEPGTITDLLSSQRLNLVLDTNTDLAFGHGNYVQSHDPDVLEAFPALELTRIASRKEPRDWEERWEDAGGEFVDGRMIALKYDPIWQGLGDGEGGFDDTLGNPYPPFAFNSGMGVREVDREEAIELGLIESDEQPEAQELQGFNEGAKMDLSGLAKDIFAGLMMGITFGSATGATFEFEEVA